MLSKPLSPQSFENQWHLHPPPQRCYPFDNYVNRGFRKKFYLKMKIEWRYSLINNMPLIVFGVIYWLFKGASPRGWDQLAISLAVLAVLWLPYYLFVQRPYFSRHPEEKPGSHIISGLGWIITVIYIMAMVVLLKLDVQPAASPAIVLVTISLVLCIRDSLSVKRLALQQEQH